MVSLDDFEARTAQIDKLLAALAQETEEPLRRTLVASLGKVGGPKSREVLRLLEVEGTESARVLAEAARARGIPVWSEIELGWRLLAPAVGRR